MTGLTRAQADLLGFIETYIAETGLSPTFGEMAAAMDLRSKSSVHQLLNALEERGCITRLVNRAQSITVLRGAAAPDARQPDIAITVDRHGIVAVKCADRVTASWAIIHKAAIERALQEAFAAVIYSNRRAAD